LSIQESAESAVHAVFEFTKKIGHPQKLSAVGVTEEHIGKAAELSMADGSIVNNVRFITGSGEVLGIYKKAF